MTSESVNDLDQKTVTARNKKWLLAAGSVFILASVSVWYFLAEPILILMKTKEKQMIEIANSVVAFNTIHNRLPRSVDEMVATGVLPNVGEIYYSPLVHESLFLRPLPYQHAEFEFDFNEEKTTIMISAETYRQKAEKLRFGWLLPKNRKIEVRGGTKFG